MRDRRTAAWVLALALPLLVAGCGDDDGPAPAAPTPTEALWNPCDALDAREVAARFGGAVAEEDGTATSPDCRFTPRGKGDPVVDANYQLFSEGLDGVFQDMGRPHGATISSPRVRGADDTRLVVATDDANLYVSGFVENGDLIQTVDVVDPKPFDRQRLERAVTWALGRLSDLAREAEVNRPPGH